MLTVGCCAVLPLLLNQKEWVVDYFQTLKSKVECVTSDAGDMLGNGTIGSGEAAEANIVLDAIDLVVLKGGYDNFAWIVGICTLLGGVIGLLKVYQGISSSIETYSRTYDLLWHHGPQALRFPLRKANSVRFFSMFVTSQVFGVVIQVTFFVILGVIILLAWVDWTGASTVRRALIGLIGAQLVEMLLLRTGIVPLIQHYRIGPLLFLTEVFYFSISIIKGVSRIIMLVVLNLDSFFTPAKCAFPDGKESWDGGHLTFVCYAMARVDADMELQKETSRQMKKMGLRSTTRPNLLEDSVA